MDCNTINYTKGEKCKETHKYIDGGGKKCDRIQMSRNSEILVHITDKFLKGRKNMDKKLLCMKKVTTLAVLFVLTLVFCLSSTNIHTVLAGTGGITLKGSGTGEDPYRIGTLEELEFVAGKINSDTKYSRADYILTADIGSETAGLTTPMGSKIYNFSGTFDGTGHTVYLNMTDSSKDYVGLFGYVYFGSSGGNIKNVVVAGTVKGKDYVGGICGYLGAKDNSTYIRNCYNKATVEGSKYVAGINGGGKNGSIWYCVNLGSVTGNQFVAGIIGDTSMEGNNNRVKYCKNSGAITGIGDDSKYVGGIAGHVKNTELTDCENSGAVTGKDYVGGVCGYKEIGEHAGLINTGAVTGTAYVGGIEGYNGTSDLKYCVNAGAVTGTTNVGAIMGFNKNTPSPKNNYFDNEKSVAPGALGGKDLGITTIQMQANSGVTLTTGQESNKPLIDFLNQYKKSSGTTYLMLAKEDGAHYPSYPYYIATSVIEGGTIRGAIENGKYNLGFFSNVGDTVEFKVSPNKGYKLKEGSLKVVGASDLSSTTDPNVYTFTMPANNVVIVAEFELTHKHVVDNEEVAFKPVSDLPSSAGNYFLTGNVNGPWTVKAGTASEPKVTNLCLNGYSIKSSSGDAVIVVPQYAVLNIFDEDTTQAYKFTVETDGKWAYSSTWGNSDVESDTVKKVSNGVIYTSANNSVLIRVEEGGKATINGGTFAGACAENGAIYNKGSLVINGGAICGNVNTSANGGGVYSTGAFVMTGGKICDNIAATNGGGLYISGESTIGGKALVVNNKLSDGTINNLGINDTIKLSVGNGASAPADGMQVGISGNEGAFTNNGSAADAKYFVSDKPEASYVTFDSINGVLGLKPVEGGKHAVIINNVENGIIYTDKQVAAVGEKITLTVALEEGYELDSLVYNDGTDHDIIEDNGTYSFTMTDTTVNVIPSIVLAGPSIIIKKAQSAQNPVFGTAADDYELFTVTARNFQTQPSLTLQWKNAAGNAWNGSAPEGVTLGTDGKVTTSTTTPIGSYIFRITNGLAETATGFIASKEMTLTIDKPAPSITEVPIAIDITYGQTLAESSLSGGATIPSGGTFTWKNGAIVPGVADSNTTEYEVVFTPDDSNYGTAICKVKVTVNKADAVLVTTPTANTLTYNGQAQELVTAGTSNDGKVLYKLGNSGTYTDIVPTVTDAGTYTVYYKVSGDDNHNDSTETPVQVTMNLLDVAGATVGAFTTMTYNGNAQTPVASVTVDGIAVAGSWSSVTNVADTTTFTATGNFTGTISNKATGMAKALVAVPSIASKVVNGQLQKAEVPASELYTVTSNVGGTEIGSYDVVLTLNDAANYKWIDSADAAKTVKFEITAEPAHAIYGYSDSIGNSVTADLQNAEKDTKITLTITTADEYSLQTLSVTNVSGAAITVAPDNTFVMPDTDVIVNAVFAKNTYDIAGYSDAAGNAVTADITNAAKGTKITLTVSTAAKYKIKSLAVVDATGKNVFVAADNTFIMPSVAVTVTAVFEKDEEPIIIIVPMTKQDTEDTDKAEETAKTEDAEKIEKQSDTEEAESGENSGTEAIGTNPVTEKKDALVLNNLLAVEAPEETAGEEVGKTITEAEREAVTKAMVEAIETAIAESGTKDFILKADEQTVTEQGIENKAYADAATEAITEVTKPAESKSVTLESAVMETLAKAEKVESLTVMTSVADVELDATTIKSINEQSDGSVRLVVTLLKEEIAQSANEDNKVYFDVSLIKEDGTKITTFDGGNIKVTLPIPKASQNEPVVVVYTDNKGHYSPVNGHVNADGTYTFITEHLSEYILMTRREAEEMYNSIYDFSTLRAHVEDRTENTITLDWNQYEDADGYIIYGNYCNHDGETYKVKKLATITDSSQTEYTVKKLESGTDYKFRIKAYKVVDGEKYVTVKSHYIHAVTLGGKQRVTADIQIAQTGMKKTNTVTLKEGQTYTVDAERLTDSGKTVHHVTMHYESSDASVATVTLRSGEITATGKGTCTVLAIAENGLYEEITVKVKQ